MPFVLGRINQVAGWTYGPTVRAAEVAVADADPLADWVDTHALPLLVGNVDYTGTGEVTLGNEMATADLALTAPRRPGGAQSERSSLVSPSAPSFLATRVTLGAVEIGLDLPRATHVTATLL